MEKELPSKTVKFWVKDPKDGRFICTLCPRHCRLRAGQRGACFVRFARADGSSMALETFGRHSGMSIDPIEKKPLFHYYPGAGILSFGTIGCNLACRYCQNWSISKTRVSEVCSEEASAEMLVAAALQTSCIGIAATYNDPAIFPEYVQDIVRVAAGRIKVVLVTAGYVSKEARPFLFEGIGAANVDLKSMDESFYRSLCKGSVSPVLETLKWLAARQDIWTEVTTLIIPGHNDTVEHMKRLAGWIFENMGPNTPLHLSAFFPHYRLLDVPPTDPQSLLALRQVAQEEGLFYVYGGNIRDQEAMNTYCPACRHVVIARDSRTVTAYHITEGGNCTFCGNSIAGSFEKGLGSWGGRPPQRVVFRRSSNPMN